MGRRGNLIRRSFKWIFSALLGMEVRYESSVDVTFFFPQKESNQRKTPGLVTPYESNCFFRASATRALHYAGLLRTSTGLSGSEGPYTFHCYCSKEHKYFSPSSADKLREKRARKWWLVRGKGNKQDGRSAGWSGEAKGPYRVPVILAILQGKGLCGKEASLLKAVLLLLMLQKK